MTVGSGAGDRSRNLVLAAMIFAVALTFIDQPPATCSTSWR